MPWPRDRAITAHWPAWLVGGVTGAQELVYSLALEDLAEAASLFRPEWERAADVAQKLKPEASE
jgi:hypothetical protein